MKIIITSVLAFLLSTSVFASSHNQAPVKSAAIQAFLDQAVNGSIEDQLLIGDFYALGHGAVGVDYIEALTWYDRAAKQGSAVADWRIDMVFRLSYEAFKIRAESTLTRKRL
ncbi:MAG: hypothetical protein RBR82_18060 [Pseudomonas sp.]|nr:hypothetical protein [Pseudomonas sp.]